MASMMQLENSNLSKSQKEGQDLNNQLNKLRLNIVLKVCLWLLLVIIKLLMKQN